MFSPCKRRDFIRKLRVLGFLGPYSGRRHEVMRLPTVGGKIPIPSNDDFGIAQLKMLLREIENISGRKISDDEWNSL